MARPRGQKGVVERYGAGWRIRYREDTPDGRRVRRSKHGFTSEVAAQRALRKVLTQIDEGTYVAPRADTIGGYLPEWVESQRPHVGANTWTTYRYHIAFYLAPDEAACAAYTERTGVEKPSLAAVRLQDLTPQRASRHLAQLLERGKRDGTGLAPRTVRGVRITLNAALASAAAAGLLPRPLQVKPISVARRAPTIYSPAQTQAFLEVATGDRLAAMWALLVTSAMRPSEVLGLPWAAVDLGAGVLAVYQKLIKVGSSAVIAPGTKTEGSAATIVLDPFVVMLLRAWQKRQQEERRLWPGPIEDHGLVFTKIDGAPLKPAWLNRHFQRLARQAGLPSGVRVYDLRHGWATAALRAGVHPQLVQEVMRHSTYTTTAQTYAHVMPGHSAEAVGTVAALFRPAAALTDHARSESEPPLGRRCLSALLLGERANTRDAGREPGPRQDLRLPCEGPRCRSAAHPQTTPGPQGIGLSDPAEIRSPEQGSASAARSTNGDCSEVAS
jgi:integrase